MSEPRAARRLGLLATTLTELLLMLFFVTLLLGLRVLSDQQEAKAHADEAAESAERELADERREADALRAQLVLVEREREALLSDLEAAAADEEWPEDFRTLVRQSVTARAERAAVEAALRAQGELAAARTHLAARERELRAQEEQSRRLREALGKGLDAPARARLEAAVAREAEARKQLAELRERHEAALLEKERASADLADTRQQAAYLRRELSGLGRGLDHPPCWFDAEGRIQYLLRVEIGEQALRVTPVWPADREDDARRLPGAAKLAASGTLAPPEFTRLAAPVLDWSRKRDPECRHFAEVVDAADSKAAYKAGLAAVESAFYKRLAR
jgi:hypothetical protein